jgi:hypothetical protein
VADLKGGDMVRKKGDDSDEQRLIDDVEQFGWHVIGIEADPEVPGFAYSVGMFHTLDHPEIIIFGLKDAKTMMQIINAIGDEVRKGTNFQYWYESDQILDGYSCVFRTVPKEVYPEYLGYAMWYYRPESVPFLQCIWPDNQGRYPRNMQASADFGPNDQAAIQRRKKSSRLHHDHCLGRISSNYAFQPRCRRRLTVPVRDNEPDL